MKNLNPIINEFESKILAGFKKDIISLYLIGSACHTEDWVPGKSDIDIFGIVKDSFAYENEKMFNKKMKQELEKKYGIECRFRAVYLSELEGGIKKSFVIKVVPPYLWSLSLRNGKLLYGKKLEVLENIKPMSVEEQVKFYSDALDGAIKDRKKLHLDADFFAKYALKFAKIEAEKKGYGFVPTYSGLLKIFKDKNHIAQEAYGLRKKKEISKTEYTKLMKDLKNYRKHMLEMIQ